jgi:hypothetical protein
MDHIGQTIRLAEFQFLSNGTLINRNESLPKYE